jgi:hypothetical protein
LNQADNTIQQNTFACATASDNQIGFSFVKLTADVVEHRFAIEGF